MVTLSILGPIMLHIPDGFLSTPVAVLGWLLAAVLVGWALRKTRGQLGERQVPLMGILAAFIFAAQMLNFPIAGGTSGHILGALAAVHMDGFAGRVPCHLSVGEKKRIAISTVLAMDPLVLILDEPTAGLDPRARRRLIELLDELPQTMLAATHDMRLVAELFPRMVIMDAGRVVADGPTRDLMRDTVLLEAHGLEQPWSREVEYVL